MPGYPGNGLATLVYEGEQGFFWDNEAIVAGAASRAFQLRRERGASYPWGFAVQVSFSGAPGTFEIDVMGSETDTADSYVKLGTINAVNTSNVGRFDTVSVWPKFVRLEATTYPNAVNATALVTR